MEEKEDQVSPQFLYQLIGAQTVNITRQQELLMAQAREIQALRAKVAAAESVGRKLRQDEGVPDGHEEVPPVLGA